MIREWLHRLWGTLSRKQRDREMQEELRSHLEMTVEEFRRAGVSNETALREARLKVGHVAQAMDALRDQRGLPWLDDFTRDLRYAVRSLRLNSSFSVVSVFTLALAIGANVAMFSIINAVLLRPLPFRSPEQLVMLWSGQGDNLQRLPYVTAEEWRRHTKTFEDIAVMDPVSLTVTDTDKAGRLSAARVSPNFFSLLGVEPLKGRTFSEEEASTRRRVALISHRLWQDRFAGSSDAIGAHLVLNGLSSEIIGVLPAGGPGMNADVYEPHTLFPDWESRRTARDFGSWFVLGRLRANTNIDKAQSELIQINRLLDESLSTADQVRGVTLVPLAVQVVGSRARFSLWMLGGAVICVLLIATANVAGLSLSRNVGRAHEFNVRATLGAGPTRILRQLLTESLALAVVSGVFGTVLAVVAVDSIRALSTVNVARLNETGIDLRVLGCALAISVVTGTLIGIAPGISMFGRNIRRYLGVGGRIVGRGLIRRRIQRGLVVAEFALAIILMTAAGLLLRSWQEVLRVDPGFKPERVLSMNVYTNAASDQQRVNFYGLVLEQIESLPGVESAGLIGDLFISSDAEPFITLDGTASSTRVRLRVDEVTDKLFATLRTPLLRGRFFSVDDRPDSLPVAIINEAMSRQLWSGDDPIGKRFKFGPQNSNEPWLTVVGVIGDMRRQGLEMEPIPQIFQPLAQRPSGNETLLVRTSTDDPLSMAPSLQAAVRRVERQTPIFAITTLEDRLGLYVSQRRFQTALVTGFSLVGLLMAAIGIYGLIHYSVATRAQEIGLRMAIGAQRRDIFRIIVHEGMRLSLVGVAVGLPAALLIGWAGSNLLFGINVTDPLTITTVTLVLAAVAATACYFPARRAMKVDPIIALRQA